MRPRYNAVEAGPQTGVAPRVCLLGRLVLASGVYFVLRHGVVATNRSLPHQFYAAGTDGGAINVRVKTGYGRDFVSSNCKCYMLLWLASMP